MLIRPHHAGRSRGTQEGECAATYYLVSGGAFGGGLGSTRLHIGQETPPSIEADRLRSVGHSRGSLSQVRMTARRSDASNGAMQRVDNRIVGTSPKEPSCKLVSAEF